VGEIIRLEDRHDETLMNFLRSREDATVYYTPAWRDTIVSTYGYRPIYLGYMEADRLTAALPLMYVDSWLTGKRLVSLPFTNACGPIGDPANSGLLLDEALRIHGELGAEALELRTQANVNQIDDTRFSSVSYFVTSLVPLENDPDVVWKRFKDKNVRTEIRQAAKKGVEIKVGESEADLKRFYRLFSASRQAHGVPPQPYGFFRNMWRRMWPENMDLYLAVYGERPVGGFIQLGFGSTICAAYIGSDWAYRAYRVHQAMIWKGMEDGCLRGYKTYDFLRTPKQGESHRYFKIRWNASEVDLVYAYYPEVRGTASTIEDTAKYALMTKVLKRSPGFVGRLVGRALYRHLG
jgi:hypothetical protein